MIALPMMKIKLYCEWAATVLAIVGSFCVANGFFHGYILFLISSSLLLAIFLQERRYPQIVVNLFFTAANIAGIYNFLLK
jgi:nicotinamide riboside transporter PnuC